MAGKLPRVICVDDEQKILNAIARSLRGALDLTTASSGAEALTIMRVAEEPFDVVVSDMKMPEMSGAVFLSHARRQFPDTVRILLTGFAEMESVVRAVNEGNIFRFLAKPCSTAELLGAIKDAVRQHELLVAEKVLVEQTLRGSIEALTNVLSLASPTLFGRASRVRQLAEFIAVEAGVDERWLLRVAADLSQIGRITLPDETAAKLALGEDLSEHEAMMVERVPAVSRDILGKIPRLDNILEILDYIDKNYDGTGVPRDKVAGENIPLFSRILKLAGRVEELQGRGYSPHRTLDTLRIEAAKYDPRLLKAYEAIADKADSTTGPRGISMHELRIGMTVVEPVKSRAGVMLVAAGQEVTEGLLGRIQNYHDTIGIVLPLWIRPCANAEETAKDLEPAIPG